MSFKINIDYKAITDKQIKLASKKLEKFSDAVLDEVNINTPEDTLKLIKNNKQSEIVKTEWKLQTKIYNDTEYAKKVEDWDWNIYNRHKWVERYIIHRWNGAHMYKKATFEMEEKFNEITN